VGDSAPDTEGAAAAKLVVLAIIIVSINTALLARVLPNARLWVEFPKLLRGWGMGWASAPGIRCEVVLEVTAPGTGRPTKRL
jgi:hypothetical protein